MEPANKPSVDDLYLSHLEEMQSTDVRVMLRKYEYMWDGTLLEINMVKHQKYLTKTPVLS